EFDWTGSHDPTPYLCVPEALRFLGGLLPGGWSALMARNRALALEARRILCDALDAEAPAPEDMVGALAAVPLPDGSAAPRGSPTGAKRARAAVAASRSSTSSTSPTSPSPFASTSARNAAAAGPAERASAA